MGWAHKRGGCCTLSMRCLTYIKATGMSMMHSTMCSLPQAAQRTHTNHTYTHTTPHLHTIHTQSTHLYGRQGGALQGIVGRMMQCQQHQLWYDAGLCYRLIQGTTPTTQQLCNQFCCTGTMHTHCRLCVGGMWGYVGMWGG